MSDISRTLPPLWIPPPEAPSSEIPPYVSTMSASSRKKKPGELLVGLAVIFGASERDSHISGSDTSGEIVISVKDKFDINTYNMVRAAADFKSLDVKDIENITRFASTAEPVPIASPDVSPIVARSRYIRWWNDHYKNLSGTITIKHFRGPNCTTPNISRLVYFPEKLYTHPYYQQLLFINRHLLKTELFSFFMQWYFFAKSQVIQHAFETTMEKTLQKWNTQLPPFSPSVARPLPQIDHVTAASASTSDDAEPNSFALPTEDISEWAWPLPQIDHEVAAPASTSDDAEPNPFALPTTDISEWVWPLPQAYASTSDDAELNSFSASIPNRSKRDERSGASTIDPFPKKQRN